MSDLTNREFRAKMHVTANQASNLFPGCVFMFFVADEHDHTISAKHIYKTGRAQILELLDTFITLEKAGLNPKGIP